VASRSKILEELQKKYMDLKGRKIVYTTERMANLKATSAKHRRLDEKLLERLCGLCPMLSLKSLNMHRLVWFFLVLLLLLLLLSETYTIPLSAPRRRACVPLPNFHTHSYAHAPFFSRTRAHTFSTQRG